MDSPCTYVIRIYTKVYKKNRSNIVFLIILNRAIPSSLDGSRDQLYTDAYMYVHAHPLHALNLQEQSISRKHCVTSRNISPQERNRFRLIDVPLSRIISIEIKASLGSTSFT